VHIKPYASIHQNLLSDESRHFGNADFIALPESEMELAQAFSEACKAEIALSMQGARTGLAGGASPSGGLVVSASRLNSILGLCQEEDGFYLWVEAGVTLRQVEEFLLRPSAPKGASAREAAAAQALRKLPRHAFEPNPSEKEATIGGLFATNARGLNSCSVGSHVHAANWVLPNGEMSLIARGKSFFNKNGAYVPHLGLLECNSLTETGFPWMPRPGMDLVDFLAGSEGRLGIAASLKLKLSPAPKSSMSIVYFFKDSASALQFGQRIAREQGRGLRSLWLANEGALSMLDEGRAWVSGLKSLPLFPQGAQSAVYAELAWDDEEDVEVSLESHLELFAACGGKEDDTWAAEDMDAHALGNFKHFAEEAANIKLDSLRLEEPGFNRMSSEASHPLPKLKAAWDSCSLELKSSSIEGFMMCNLMDGRLHIRLLPQNLAQAAVASGLMLAWGEKAIGNQGVSICDYGAGKLRKALALSLMRQQELDCLKRIQEFFDPKGLMSNKFF
jgi:D-lactate dehydrogenase (cytochrome)